MKKQEIEKIEKILEVSDKDVSTKDFSGIWEEIKDRDPNANQSERVTPRKRNRKMLTLVASLVGVLLVGGIVTPIAVSASKNNSITYFSLEQLEKIVVEKNELYQVLETAKIQHVSFDEFELQECRLYQTKNTAIPKGALMSFFDDGSYNLTVEFYDKTVKYPENQFENYTLTYSVNGADICYKLKETYETEGLYVYEIKANYNSVNYFMEYYCYTEDIEPFFDSFFS